LNDPDLRQLKQRVALRCVIKALPNVEETDRYITSRLLAAGAERTDIFSADAVDYLYRCTEGIPRNINNLCDNALLSGYAAGDLTIGRSVIEEVAGNLDMLPRQERGLQAGEENELPARIFSDAGRAELWAAGNGNGDSHS
jgi:general secretion pathway protein A